MSNIFDNQRALLVSIHGKEEAIAPVLKSEFNIDLEVSKNINTDEFGTFSGEVKRIHSQYETTKLKIAEAIKKHPQSSLFIASEGSFNPHPEAPFITLNTELLLLIDRKNDIEIEAWYNSVNTNLAQAQIKSVNELNEFAQKIGFPQHGIILKADSQSPKYFYIYKGAKSIVDLKNYYNSIINISNNITVEAETDMRANFNPTRMKNISECATILVANMKSTCPQCEKPGFTIKSTKQGLPCKQCSMPTRSVLFAVYQCNNCKYVEEKKYPKGKHFEDPMYCDFCNP